MRGVILLALVGVVVLAAPLASQSVDRWRERQAWIPAWLDNTDPKSWVVHAAITVVAGHAIGLLPHVSAADGMRLMYGFYFVREVWTRTHLRPARFDWEYKPVDGVFDFAVPLIVAELVIRW